MGVNSVTRVSGPPCHAGLSRIIRMPDEASREKLRSGVPNGRESAKVLQLFDGSHAKPSGPNPLCGVR